VGGKQASAFVVRSQHPSPVPGAKEGILTLRFGQALSGVVAAEAAAPIDAGLGTDTGSSAPASAPGGTGAPSAVAPVAATPAVDPTVRWNPGLPELIGATRYASKQAAHNPDWVGSTQIFTHLADEPTSISFRPVFLSGHLIGSLVSFGVSDGAQLPQAEGSPHPRLQPRRLVATRDNRMVLLRLPEVSFAESEGNDVWLSTDQGRLRAASQGLDKLDGELADAGFLRVHRRYVVNLSRIREIERGLKGELFLVMDDRTNKMVPVSRRNAPAVRRALDI